MRPCTARYLVAVFVVTVIVVAGFGGGVRMRVGISICANITAILHVADGIVCVILRVVLIVCELARNIDGTCDCGT